MNEQIKATCDQMFADIEIMIRNAVLKEREACAKVCDAYKNPNDPFEPVSQFNSGAYTTAEALADEIRARGEVK